MAAIEKKQKMTDVGKDGEKLEALCIFGENAKWGCCFENSMVVSKIMTSRISRGPSNTTSGCRSKRTETRTSRRCSHCHVRNSIIHNSQEVEATQVSVHGWMDKQNAC